MEEKKNRSQRIVSILRKQKNNCAICGGAIDYNATSISPLSFQADHIIPLSLGGKDTLENLQATHRICNARKGCHIKSEERIKEHAKINIY